jgi:hypothetical protein
MKKIVIFNLFSLIMCQTLYAQIQDVVTFSYNSITFDTIGEYTRVSMIDCGTIDSVGYPELPVFEVRYIIPWDKQVSYVTVTDSVVQVLQGSYKIYPKQSEIPVGDTTLNHLYIDSLVYCSNHFCFKNSIEYVGQFHEFGYRVALFYIYPVNYLPSQEKLQFYTSISFTIQLSNYNSSFQRPKLESRRMFEMTKKLITAQIRNVDDFNCTLGGPVRIVECNEKVSAFIPLLQNGLEVLPEYIVITNDSDIHGNDVESYNSQTMTDIFKVFADWKTRKGIPTIVVTIDDICSFYSGNDIQSKIHNFLVDVYKEYGTLYVLFGGDVNIVPERMSDTIVLSYSDRSVQKHSFPTDLYYTAIEKTWDSNHNGIYGEITRSDNDSTDNTPEFIYGRIPVENCNEAAIFLSKESEYEDMTNVGNRNYVNNVLMIAGMVNNTQSESQSFVRENLDAALGLMKRRESTNVTWYYGISQDNIVRWRLFESFYHFDYVTNQIFYHSIGWENHSFNLCQTNVLGALGTGFNSSQNNEYPHLIFHTDHSSYLSLGTSAKINNESINRNDVDELQNAPYYQILMTQGCSLGEFQKDCIVERFLNNPYGGTVAVLASSSISYRDKEKEYQKRFLTSCFDSYNRQGGTINAMFYNIGIIYDYVHQQTGDQRLGVYTKRKNHLFGDPELPIWTREPVDLTVSTTPSTITNESNELTVSVSGMAYSEYSTNDVMVCVMKDGEVYLREHYDGTAHNHDFVFQDIHPETTGELKITVTGHNYIPYETSVPVTITGKNVYIIEKLVVDVTGNNDGILDSGETDNLSISLKNNGTVALSNVTATLSCEFLDENLNQNINDYLVVVNSTVNYGTIAQNATVTRNAFQLALSNAIPDRTSIRCTLTVSDGSGVVSERSFTLLVKAPEIEYVSVRHEERPNGRIVLGIELNNLGYGTAKGITAILASSDVQITEGTALYGAMTHLEAITQYFEFIPYGGIDGQSFTLTVTDAYNKSWSFDFVLYDILDTVENLSFTNTEHSIQLKWVPVEDSRGYYVYRSMTVNGNYERLNNYPIPSASYPDLGLEVKQTYYYGVSYLDEYGNESKMARITAWTSLPIAEGWPVAISDDLGRAWGTAPNVADVDDDGKQEIFLTTGVGDQRDNIGAILGFNNQGEELYDIDYNPTTISGFANPHISMTCTPAIGDIDNDGIMEVVVATRCDENGSNYKLYVYKNVDSDKDGAPDLAWEPKPLDFMNFNGVVLADLADDGTLEIIVPNQGRNEGNGNTYTYLEVFDCFGNYYYPKEKIKVIDPCNNDEKAVTMPVVADFDNDGYKEIVFGLEGGVYLWGYSNQAPTPLVESNPGTNNPNDYKERMDCPVIAADIDGDGDLEILYMVIKDLVGYIRAVESDGMPVNSAWSGDAHYVSLSSSYEDYEWPPYFCVADIDNDGSIEIFVADGGALKIWNSDGTAFGQGVIQITDLNCEYFQPIIADVDGNGDCEIIVPSQNGNIYAYKPNGDVVPGWPLAVVDLATIPAITDIDGDGFNEVIAASQTELYVWHTEGESKYNQWDRFRYNKHNNAVYEIPCSYNEVPLEITGTQVWNDDRHVNRDVIVNNGATLTIKSELQFSEDSKIIVKPGGRLIIDGGKLTNACSDEFWQGIEVWGNSSTHQNSVHGQLGQGYIELKNGAIIENAKCAVELWRPGYWSTTGGIIHATDATFRNNAMAVRAVCYQNYNYIHNTPMAYNGYFNNCSFVVDEDYLGTETFKKHVVLAEVDGISFSGCSFSAKRDVQGIHRWCIGISAYDASFVVNALCNSNASPCPDQYLDRSTFMGLCAGIHASSNGSHPGSFTVQDAVFTNNDRGIRAKSTGFPTILDNEFNVGKESYCDYKYGIYLENVTGFCVEENTFRPVSGTGGSTIGIAIYDSEGTNDIFRNHFENLSCGNLAKGVNTGSNSSGTSGSTTGLTYTCNTNKGNNNDFRVFKREDGGDIQQQQGSYTMPAGNTFDAATYHFDNQGDHTILYYYNDTAAGQAPNGAQVNRVSLQSTQNVNPCNTHYGGGSVDRSASEKAALASDYLTAHTAYLSLKQLYESRIDGGSTPTQVADINAATPSDMWQLRARLLGISPYVSTEVLTAAADRDDVFTDPVLFEILAANPDELRSDSLISYLENKNNPLPSYMVNLLRQIASGVTARTALESQMNQLQHDYSIAAGDIIRSNLYDSVANPNELRTWLGNMNDIAADRMVISSYLQEGDSTSAFTLANMLPELYGLEGDRLTDHSGYMQLIQLYQSLNSSGRTVYEMTENETAMVDSIAENGIGVSRELARNLTEQVLGTIMETCLDPGIPNPGGGGRGSAIIEAPSVNQATGFAVSIGPNPATTWTEVDYTLPFNKSKGSFIVTNALGTVMVSAELEGRSGKKILDLRGLANGVYVFTIRCGELVHTGKLVITK